MSEWACPSEHGTTKMATNTRPHSPDAKPATTQVRSSTSIFGQTAPRRPSQSAVKALIQSLSVQQKQQEKKSRSSRIPKFMLRSVNAKGTAKKLEEQLRSGAEQLDSDLSRNSPSFQRKDGMSRVGSEVTASPPKPSTSEGVARRNTQSANEKAAKQTGLEINGHPDVFVGRKGVGKEPRMVEGVNEESQGLSLSYGFDSQCHPGRKISTPQDEPEEPPITPRTRESNRELVISPASDGNIMEDEPANIELPPSNPDSDRTESQESIVPSSLTTRSCSGQPNIGKSNSSMMSQNTEGRSTFSKNLKRRFSSRTGNQSRSAPPKDPPILQAATDRHAPERKATLSVSRASISSQEYHQKTMTRLDDAIAGLEQLLKEALSLAKEAAETHHLEELPEILEGAASVLGMRGDSTGSLPAKSIKNGTCCGPGAEDITTPKNKDLQRKRVPKYHENNHQPHATHDSNFMAVETGLATPGIVERGGRLEGPQATSRRIIDDWRYNPEYHIAIQDTAARSRLATQTSSHQHGRQSHKILGNPTVTNSQSRAEISDVVSRNRAQNVSNSEDIGYFGKDDALAVVDLEKGEEQRNSRFHYYVHRRRSSMAREWQNSKKRWVAAVTCLRTSLLGLTVGVYAGEVPAIQYQVVDRHHYVILGNVLLYFGLAIVTFFAWPLPVLHGRKRYSLVSLTLFLVLQIPQALVVASVRNPNQGIYRVWLLLPRALSGMVLGFANISFMGTLLDIFGASLQSANPHQEFVDENDVRRRGGGLGIWLGIWTWCFIVSIGLGFFFGAAIVTNSNPAYGFWFIIFLTILVIFLSILCPETRKTRRRRTIAEIRSGQARYTKIVRGEISMHVRSIVPVWWWDEVYAGVILCWQMFRQPGFSLLVTYLAFIYGQVVGIIVLLGALMSKYYRYRPIFVGLCVLAMPLGAVLAIPFEQASMFSRSRRHVPRTDSATFHERYSWSSHLFRRALFTIALPFADLAYLLSSNGPPTHYMLPVVFAGTIGFLSNLAIAECNGLIMETFDTSDLEDRKQTPGVEMESMESVRNRVLFTCFPRVSAAFAIAESAAFLLGAAATGIGGVMERRLGAQLATGITAAILLALTFCLAGVLYRYKQVQVIPSWGGTGFTGEDWKPVIHGHPSGTMRRVNLLELGKMSRWTEIRRRNRLIVS